MRTPRRTGSPAALLAALLLVIAAVTATALTLQGDRSGRAAADGAPAALAGTAEHTLTFRNRTDGRIWVGSTVNADGSAALTGLPMLEPGQSATITIPEHSGAGHWRGKFFARQGCTGEAGSTFHCTVGDCGPYPDHCSLGDEPTGLAEFNFDPADPLAPWYNVSYVNAVSVPITITPDNLPLPEAGECAVAGCAEEMLSACPAENLVKDPATGAALVCVNPNRDARTAYSDMIAEKCPTAYGWSKQDAEAGNRVVYQCTKCSGMTVTFGTGDTPTTPATPTTSPGGDTTASRRRGISLNPVDGAARALTDSGAHWYYNWASSTGPVARPDGVEYVPMIWGPGSVTDAELGMAANEGTALLGFNEPDRADQANLTPEQALDLWPRLQSTGLRLGAPAVSYGGEVADGWLDRFMRGAAERGLRVDFIPLHWYGGDFGPDAANQLRGYLQAVHDRYGKPIWLTEYGLIDFSQNPPRYPSEGEQTAFVESSTRMLEGLDFVERYAWFTLSTRTAPTGLYDGTTPNASGRAYRDADPTR
ncbi:glycosyl hydrolase [Streptomyces sp. NPDC000983]|uniref:glycosyl hydrolase n=1 Tax=Streptomyces sp. NPDC000983 TaxID=3154373 RepID=UPI003318D210